MVCKECLHKIVAHEDMWCYIYVERPKGPCKQFIAWKAIRDFVGKMVAEAMSLYG